MHTPLPGSSLVVDDEPQVLVAIGRLFKRDPICVRTAGNGLEALDLLDRHDVDLVITDQRMPLMCGSQLIKEIGRRHRDIDCMMLSGHCDHAALARAVNYGRMVQFIPKPWNAEKVRDRVLQLLSQREQERHRGEQQRSERALLRRLRLALRTRELELQYQPKLHLVSGELLGAEALCRWTTRDGAQIPPQVFIDLAERHQLIAPLGDWVLNEACRQRRRWQQQGMNQALAIAVNIAPSQLQSESFSARVKQVLRQHGLGPHQLALELTEQALINGNDNTARNIDALRALGVTLSIDDFGTEYANFGALCRHPFDQLKLDKSLVDGIDAEPRKQAIVKAILQMAVAMGMETVAEGIERSNQAAVLRRLGCGQAQGFLFSPALPAAEFEHRYLASPCR